MAESLQALLAERRWGELLHALLDDWRARREPALADAIDEVSTCLDQHLECPGGSTVSARVEGWSAFCKPSEPPTLRPALKALERWKRPQLVEALAALQGWPADPRLAAWHQQRLTFERADLHLTPLGQLGDVRALEALRELERQALADPSQAQPLIDWREGLASAIGELSSVRRVALSAAELTLLEEVKAVARSWALASRELRERLFAAVYAAPHDDGPRAVLADALLEQGEPRGEFIALQLARGRAGRPSSRETAMLKQWAERWLEPITDGVVKGTTFERGFPASCQLRNETPSHEAREWATIERIDTEGLGARLPGSFFAATRFPVLRELGPVDGSILCAPEPMAVQRLTVNWCADPEMKALLQSTAFPHLHSLVVNAPVRFDALHFEGLASAPVGATLRELDVQLAPNLVGRWARQLATFRGPLTSVVVRAADGAWRWDLEATPVGLRVKKGQALPKEHAGLPIASAL